MSSKKNNVTNKTNGSKTNKSSKKTTTVEKVSKKKKQNAKSLAIRIFVFAIVCIFAVGVGFGFKQQIENFINKTNYSSDQPIDEIGLTTHFVDVGQGDGIAIRFPDGKTMLVDAGPAKSSNKLISYLKNNFFKHGEDTFDYLLLTHSDEDHCSGMVRVCEEFTIKKIFRPYIYSKNSIYNLDETDGDSTNKTICETQVYCKTIKAFYNETSDVIFTDITVMNTTQKIEGEGYSVDFYYPTKNYLTKSDINSAGTVVNNYSPIMVLNYNQRKIMLTGDVSTAGEQMAMNSNTLPDVDVLKIAHHGSETSTGQEFLSQTKPEYSVICVGANSYGHPTNEVLNRLASVGSTVYRTDKNGNIIVNITSDAIASINIFFDTTNLDVYIHVEYLIGGVILIALYFCFGLKIKVK